MMFSENLVILCVVQLTHINFFHLSHQDGGSLAHKRTLAWSSEFIHLTYLWEPVRLPSWVRGCILGWSWDPACVPVEETGLKESWGPETWAARENPWNLWKIWRCPLHLPRLIPGSVNHRYSIMLPHLLLCCLEAELQIQVHDLDSSLDHTQSWSLHPVLTVELPRKWLCQAVGVKHTEVWRVEACKPEGRVQGGVSSPPGAPVLLRFLWQGFPASQPVSSTEALSTLLSFLFAELSAHGAHWILLAKRAGAGLPNASGFFPAVEPKSADECILW